jgi:hypothetical protein
VIFQKRRLSDIDLHPRRMAPKAMRRRMIRQHNRRMRAQRAKATTQS